MYVKPSTNLVFFTFADSDLYPSPSLLHVQIIERPFTLIEEDPQCRRLTPVARVDKMFEQILAKLPGEPQFILCVLPEKKNSDIYGMSMLLKTTIQLPLDSLI